MKPGFKFLSPKIVSLYKRKWGKSMCNHYRGITLLEAVGNVFTRLLLNRLFEDGYPVVIPEGMIFSAKQIQKNALNNRCLFIKS